MPSCPRCGKRLCSQQALEYHLQKKKRCNSLTNCESCGKSFRSREEFLIHKQNCTMPPQKLSRIVRNDSFNNVYILDQKLNIVHNENSDVIGKQFVLLFHPYTRDRLRDEIRTGMEKSMYKKVGTGCNRATYLCSFPCGDKFVVLEKPFVVKNKLPGSQTP